MLRASVLVICHLILRNEVVVFPETGRVTNPKLHLQNTLKQSAAKISEIKQYLYFFFTQIIQMQCNYHFGCTTYLIYLGDISFYGLILQPQFATRKNYNSAAELYQAAWRGRRDLQFLIYISVFHRIGSCKYWIESTQRSLRG